MQGPRLACAWYVGYVDTWRLRVASLLVIGFALAGCRLDVDYGDGKWACDEDRVCPDGLTCSSAGLCVSTLQPIDDASFPADEPDASADASPGAPDARPSPPDARPRPDAEVPVDAALPDAGLPVTTMSFTATRDTQLYSPDPTFNFGIYAEIQCAARSTPSVDSPVLFGFNVAAIPSGAHVVTATMRLTVSSNAMTAGAVSAFALNEDWTEGSQSGTPGVANYLDRQAGVPWSSEGASPPSRVLMPFALFTANQTQTAFDFPVPPSLVQGWVDHPAQNFGVILTCPLGQDVTFYTRLGGSAAQHPRLSVTFVP
jgi:hypothetical protein